MPGLWTQRIPRRLSFGFTEYGYKYTDGQAIPPEYLVRITSYKHGCSVVAPLQEDISLRVESRWEPFIPISLLARANILAQAVTGGRRSFITKATSRRVWMGCSPMAISLKLKFEAIEDTYVEVVEPVRMLQSMAVPSDPGASAAQWAEAEKGIDAKDYWSAISKLPALQPPGPTPFTWTNLIGSQKAYPNKTQTEIAKSAKGGDFIMVELGRFLTFWNVIIRENTANFKIKFDSNGDPVSSEVDVVVETYEMPTVESLRDSYKKFTTSEDSI